MKEGFTSIDNDVLDNAALNIQEQSLLIAIISYLGMDNAHPSYETLKRRSKIASDRTLIKSIIALEKKGFIKVIRRRGKSNVYKLTLKMQYLQKYSTCKITVQPPANMQYKKEKEKENNIYTRVIEYLNRKADTNYKASTKKTKSLIRARQNEGFTLDDFKNVIDNKVLEWKGTDFEKFLRPETLFGNKFEGYLNQKVKSSPNHKERTFNSWNGLKKFN